MTDKDRQEDIAKAITDKYLYDRDTGIFIRRSNEGIVSKIDKDGYIRLFVNMRYIYAHRAAWLICHGSFPEIQIDHINGVRNDNRISNLREATRSQNMHNMSISKNNKSGYKGVSLHKSTGLWQAKLKSGGVIVFRKFYKTKEEANNALIKERKKAHGEFCNHGQFA